MQTGVKLPSPQGVGEHISPMVIGLDTEEDFDRRAIIGRKTVWRACGGLVGIPTVLQVFSNPATQLFKNRGGNLWGLTRYPR
jgi:hypothetical protein